MSNVLILASASPRRADLLRTIGCRFEVVPSAVNEQTRPEITPIDVVTQLAARKADDVAQQYPDRIVIGADTIVIARDHILGKPEDRDDARRTLQRLSGATHQVFTAISLVLRAKGRSESALARTDVTFRALSDEEIERYLDTSEPYDKAGSYGIQGRAALFAEDIQGCFYNVVGFPVTQFWLALNRMTDGTPEAYLSTTPTPDLLALDG